MNGLSIFTNTINVCRMRPAPDLLTDRDDDKAYAMDEEGRQYAVHFPDGGDVGTSGLRSLAQLEYSLARHPAGPLDLPPDSEQRGYHAPFYSRFRALGRGDPPRHGEGTSLIEV